MGMRVPAILAVVFSASILLGCQIGVLPIIAHHFSDVFFSSSSKENLLIIVLPCVVAAMSAIAGWLSDTVGRRQWILLGVACLAVGGVETAIAETLFELVLGRILVGIGAGFVAVILPLYLVELAPKARRGQWVALNCMAINMGIFLSSLMGGLFVEHHTWRFALMLSALPGVLLYLACLYLPESPRWLLFNGQQGKAGKLLIRLFGSKQAMSIINQMDAVNHRQIYQHVRLWSMQGLRLLLVGLLINIFSQALGVHAVIAYSALVLEKMSFQDHIRCPASRY
jgi:MFS family permease